ncbi:MAG: hypothetical protein BMS9Abin20_0124 [Acidimicrobiia bacterium]|nr:MAG: hypothetical protein BMS9Abin20_0124 [Acidimicrobiia bacterium]
MRVYEPASRSSPISRDATRYDAAVTAFDGLAPGERLPVSATLYTTYQRCPQQALARLQGVYAPATRASLKGSLAHRVFAHHLEKGPIDQSDFEQVCRQEIGASLGETMASLTMKPSEFRTMVGEVAELYDRFVAVPTDGFVEAEASIEVEPVDGVVLKGRVDAVFDDEGSVRIVDWKTGSDLTGSNSQLDFYAMVWSMAFGTSPRTLEAMSVRTGEKLVKTPTEADIECVQREVAEMVAELRSAISERGELPRTAGPFCRWCPLLDECSEGSAAVAILK